MGPFNKILALVQIMAWSWPGDKSLSKRIMVSLLTHMCGPQWVKVTLAELPTVEYHWTLLILASKFRIECTCPSGKWIVNITCLNVPFTCLKYIKPMQLMWKSEIHNRPSDKSWGYSTCPTVIFNHLRRSDEWNFEPCDHDKITLGQVMTWWRQATSHYLSQCWFRSMSPYGVTRPQWVKSLSH